MSEENGKPKASDVLVRLEKVGKAYERGGERLQILEDLDLDIERGSLRGADGPVGLGQDHPAQPDRGPRPPHRGLDRVGGKQLEQLGEGELARFRADTIGFIFQSYNLMPVLNAVENVELPLLLTKVPSSERRKRAETALRVVGLEDRKGPLPAPALRRPGAARGDRAGHRHRPDPLVADEPTGDLDRKSADEILGILEQLNRELGKTIVMVTHDPAAAERAKIIRRLDKGALEVTLVGLAARNVLRNKFRTALTVLGVAVAVITFLLLRTVVWSYTIGAEVAAKDRVVTRHKVTFVMTLPKRYIDDVRTKVPGVKVGHLRQLVRRQGPEARQGVLRDPRGRPGQLFEVYDDMRWPDALERWKHDPQGAIVGDVLAKKMGWKVGDKVTLAERHLPPKQGDWEFTVVGIYKAKRKSVDRSTFVFHWDYLNESLPEARKDQIGWIVAA